MTVNFLAKDIAKRFGGQLFGSVGHPLVGVASLDSAKDGSITFCESSAHASSLRATKASLVVLRSTLQDKCPVAALVVNNPRQVFAEIAGLFVEQPVRLAGIDATVKQGQNCQIDASVSIGAHVVLGNNVKVGARVIIGAGCVLGDNVVLGAGCILHPRVVLYAQAQLGADCIIHSGAVLGSDGFGYVKQDSGRWQNIPQMGRVCLGNRVEIGANSCIDCGALDDTVLASGVKCDNLVQIGHNVRIGENTIIAGCVGIAGSATIGANCMLGGAVRINGHISIVDNVHLAGGTMVMSSIDQAGAYASGLAQEPIEQWRRNVISMQSIAKLVKRVSRLEKANVDK